MADIVLDCDIVSTLAKIDKIDLLSEVFKDRRIVIPNAVLIISVTALPESEGFL